MNTPISPVAIPCLLAAATNWHVLFDRAVNPAALQKLGWVLLHFLWQGSAVAALLVVVLGLLRRQSAAIRYRVACAALLAMAVAPLATYWVIALETTAVADSSRWSAIVMPVQTGSQGIHLAQAQHSSDTAGPVVPAEARGEELVSLPWTWVVAVWAIGVAGLSLWRAGGWLHLQWLIRRTTPLGGVWTDRLQTLARQMRVRRTARLAEAAWVAVPCVVGLFRPMILVPVAALTELTPFQLEAILAHELAHIRRHDYVINLAQAVLETVLFYHPAVWWVSARVREEREFCCDDLAAATRPSPADYADALAAAEMMRDAETRSLAPHLALAALGGGRKNGPLLRRVRRLLGLPPGWAGGSCFPRPLTAIAVAAACVAMPWVMARADKSPATTPSPDALPMAVSAKSPSTAPADTFAAAEPPGPDDLVADKGPYLIGPNDLLTVEINDLTGPGTQAVKVTRVKANGRIELPYLAGPITAAGLTEAQLEQAITDAYHVGNIIQQSNVKVVITEARSRLFQVLGDVPRPLQSAIVDPDFRMLNALKLTGADLTKLDRIYVIRTPRIVQTAHDLDIHPTARAEMKVFHLKHGDSHSTARLLLQVFKLPDDAKEKPEPGSFPYGVNAVSDDKTNNVIVTAPAEAMKVVEQVIHQADQPPIIVVSAKGLAAGDPKLNVVIHKGDIIIAHGLSRKNP